MEDDADEVAARPIAPIRQGTSHPLHVRKLIAMAVHTRKERKEKLYQIAERFGVDRKTARVYHRLWVDDGKPDYADEEEIRRSVLRPMARRTIDEDTGKYTSERRLTRGERRFGTEEKWRRVAAKIVEIQTAAPTFTASDIAGFTNRNGADAPGISKMLGELHGLFRNSDYETIFFSLFETVTADHERKFTHLHNLFFKETSVFYSRDYVDGYKNRNTTYDFLLAREIYKNLNLAFKRDGAANQSLGKWEIAAHVWKMVHTYGGDKDRLIDPTLDSVRLASVAETGVPYTFGDRGEEDAFFNGDFYPDKFAQYLRDNERVQIKQTRAQVTIVTEPDDAANPNANDAFYTNVRTKRTGACLGKMAEGKYPDPSKPPSRALTTVVRADEKKDFERDETTYFCPAANPVAPGAEYFTKYDVRKGDDGQIRAVQCVRKGVKDYKLGEHVRVLWQGAWRRAKIERLPEANKNTRTPSKTKVTNSPWFTVSLSDTNESVRVMISKIRPSKGKIRKLMAKHERMVEEIEARNRDVIAKRVAEWTAQRRRATDLRADLRMSRAFTSAEALDAVRVAARRMEKHEDAVRESIAPALRAWSASNAAETPGATRRAAALRPDPALTRSRTARGGVGLPGGGGTTSGAVPSATGAAGAAGPSASPTPAPPPVPRREMARLPRVYASFY
eukprot:jgi/Mesvir1/12880/Mv05906-RA.1